MKLATKALPLKTASVRLAAKDLGRIVAVQDRGGLLSLVRIAHGLAACDCPEFTATKQPCAHIAAAARLLADDD